MIFTRAVNHTKPDPMKTETIEGRTHGLLLLAEVRLNAQNDAEYRPHPQLLTD